MTDTTTRTKSRGFVIDKDHIGNDREGTTRVFTRPHSAQAFREDVAWGRVDTVRFRAYDGDNILYYEGRCTVDDYDGALFQALRWMQWDAGVTHLRILDPDQGRWVDFP